jgi:hypothetical protein
MFPSQPCRRIAAKEVSRRNGRNYLREALIRRAAKKRIITAIYEMGLKPVLMGKVPVFCVLIPPGGWEPIYQKHPCFHAYSPADQLRIALGN